LHFTSRHACAYPRLSRDSRRARTRRRPFCRPNTSRPAYSSPRKTIDPGHRLALKPRQNNNTPTRKAQAALSLGDAQELLLHVRTSGRDAVVPFWMEGIALYVECRDLLVGDLDALGIEFAADFETGFRRGVCDQFDGHEEADERHGAPVLGNVAEHAVLDLVPLRGPRRIMADLDDQAGLVGELLQRHLPQS